MKSKFIKFATSSFLGFLIDYALFCGLVFREKQTIKSALSYFALVLFILCMNNVVLLGYLAILGIPLYVAKIFTELTLFLISYVVQKKVIFRHKF